MKKTYKFNGLVTVSCWTQVEANSLEEAKEIAGERELAGLCLSPFSGGDDEEWHFEADGEPTDISLDEDLTQTEERQ